MLYREKSGNPAYIAKKEVTYGKIVSGKETFREKWAPIGRVFRNKLFVSNLLASVTSMFISSGFGTFAPKFFQVPVTYISMSKSKL
jgi:hypothetical protein